MRLESLEFWQINYHAIQVQLKMNGTVFPNPNEQHKLPFSLWGRQETSNFRFHMKKLETVAMRETPV